jgi:hypothetical protein
MVSDKTYASDIHHICRPSIRMQILKEGNRIELPRRGRLTVKTINKKRLIESIKKKLE